MTKAGKKLLAAVEEVLAIARGDMATISKVKVTPSCGCVFCDLGLTPDADNVHRAEGHPDIECERHRADD